MLMARTGKTAPRLLQDLLTYDPRHEARAGRNLLTDPPPHHDEDASPIAAVPGRNCRHVLMTKHEQSLLPEPGEVPTHETVYKIASFCMHCQWHIDLTVDFRDNGSRTLPCRRNTDFPIHHFIWVGGTKGVHDASANPIFERTSRFQCSAPKCPVDLHIRISPPRLSAQHITLMTSPVLLKKRLDAARELDPARTDHDHPARPVDALDFLSTYLQDSLQPKHGKARIPLLNRKFIKTFGKDCDEILLGLGFMRQIVGPFQDCIS